jgi:hypothetical protein
VALAAAASLAAWGCCDGLSIRLSRVADFLSGVVSVSGEVSAEFSSSDPGLATASFDGDFASFADIPAFPADQIETDLSAAAYLGRHAARDVDCDAAEEDMTVLYADVASPAADVVFASWSGDAYTADKGVCYLGWVEGGEARLAASWCGDDSGLMYCSMPTAAAVAAPTCELCDSESGACAACDMGGRLFSCLPPKSVSGGIDIDIDIDFDHDGDLAPFEDSDGAP